MLIKTNYISMTFILSHIKTIKLKSCSEQSHMFHYNMFHLLSGKRLAICSIMHTTPTCRTPIQLMSLCRSPAKDGTEE